MLGEVPIEINAAAQKCRETPMRLANIIEKVIFNAADFERSKLSSAKAQHRRIVDSLYCWVEIFLYQNLCVRMVMVMDSSPLPRRQAKKNNIGKAITISWFNGSSKEALNDKRINPYTVS